jgi:hypothetical protein
MFTQNSTHLKSNSNDNFEIVKHIDFNNKKSTVSNKDLVYRRKRGIFLGFFNY